MSLARNYQGHDLFVSFIFQIINTRTRSTRTGVLPTAPVEKWWPGSGVVLIWTWARRAHDRQVVSDTASVAADHFWVGLQRPPDRSESLFKLKAVDRRVSSVRVHPQAKAFSVTYFTRASLRMQRTLCCAFPARSTAKEQGAMGGWGASESTNWRSWCGEVKLRSVCGDGLCLRRENFCRRGRGYRPGRRLRRGSWPGELLRQVSERHYGQCV